MIRQHAQKDRRLFAKAGSGNAARGLPLRRALARGWIWLFLIASITAGIGFRMVLGTRGAIIVVEEFDGERAMEWLRRQVGTGPRVAGTESHVAACALLAQGLGADTQRQEFTHTSGRTAVRMTNLVARLGPQTGERILLCAHWDTRPFADCEPRASDRKRPVPGANDGASGVAVLLELARVLRVTPPPVGVTIVLFDGEDYGRTAEEMFLGARYFAAHPIGEPFRYGILLDMVGDADLQIYREQHSQEKARFVVDRVWSAAADLGYDHFRPSVGYSIEDDHVPLLQAGIPVIDVIDFDYPPWHTLQDLPDKCSARSLKIVGDVVRRVVYTEK